MLKYIIRRVLQMIPTIIGVILITFILFNVVGGSPGLMTLGKHVSPQLLEEFDEQRGFNKPLLFGWWAETHAFSDMEFEKNAGVMSKLEGLAFVADSKRDGYIRLSPDHTYMLPVAFALRAETGYRWKIRCRGEQGAMLKLYRAVGEGDASELASFNVSTRWGTEVVEFDSGSSPEGAAYELRVEGGSVEIDTIRFRRHVSNPFDSQLAFYFGRIARLDLGESHYTKQKVSTMIRQGVLPSLALTVPMFFVGLALAIAMSLLCAFFRDRFIDRLFVVLSVALMSINYIVWIILGQYIMGYKLGWFPVWGYESWQYLMLPITIGIVSGLGASIRFYRTIMLDEMYKDYVRTAFAKGVTKKGVLFKHVLKNAMIPIVTNVVIAIPFLYTGSLLLESFFGIPGLGYIGINAINSSDVDVVRAIVLIGAVMFVIANLVTDICYAIVDPRVKLQ